ncbi:GAF domain-containing protein [Halorussus marinus]|uniref:GAF domain-containing protein n=1 Tax=Halorussus marinus TaxID=2505976 RepID=UPI0010930F88|nr:GAF domain-containing protein [Halorussus marinus]
MLPQSVERGPHDGDLRRVLYVDAGDGDGVADAPSFTLETESRATDALGRLDAERFDCVIAGPDLPETDGITLLETVGELFPAVGRVLVADSVADAPDGVEFVSARPSDDRPARLARRVARVLDRRETERSRDLLADRFGTLVECSPDAMLTLDDDCTILFANAATERVFGYDPAELVGDSVGRLLAERVRGSVRAAIAELREADATAECEYVELPGRDREGEEIPLVVSVTESVRDGRRYYSCIVREVSERKRLEERLGEERRKTRDLHDVAVMLEACDTADEVCRLAVETAEQLLEFDIAAVDIVEDDVLVPRAVSKGIPSDGYYTTTPIDADDKLAARALRADETIRTGDLREAGVDPAATGYRSALTVPIGETGVFQAVSKESDSFDESDRELAELLVAHMREALARIRSERALAAERDRFAALFEHIPEPTVDYQIRDGRCLIEAVNPAFEAVFGYDAEEAVGEAAEELIVPEEARAEAEHHIQKVKAGEQINAEVRRETAEGYRDFLLRNADMPGEDNAGYLIYTDITDRKQLERDLSREKEKIERLHHVAVRLESSESPDEIYQRTVDAAEEILKFDSCSIDVDENGWFVARATSSELETDDYPDLRTDAGLAGKTYQTGETYVVDDAQSPDGPEVLDEKYRSFLSVPVGDRGVFQAASRSVGEFDGEDARLAELLLSHAVQALVRVESKSALRAERDRFAALFENVPEPIADYEFRDGEPIVRSVNEAFEAVFGYDADRAVGRSLDDLITPDGERGAAERLNEQVRAGERVDAEVRREAADGIRDFLLRNAEVSGSPGNYVIYTDITERKERERRHRSMTEDVLDNTDVGIFVLDEEFDVAWANATVEEYFGVDREDLLGRDKETLVDERIAPTVEDSAHFAETVVGTYEDNTGVEQFSCRVTPAEGRAERYLQHRSRPIESGLYAGGRVELYYDVTERTEREEMLDALHGASRRLMAAQSQREIAETAVETAAEVLDIPHTTVLRWNDDAGVLEPYIVPPETTAEIGETPDFAPGEGIVGSVFESGEPEHFDNAYDDPRAHDDGASGVRAFAAFPLGDWGVLTIVSTTPGAFDDYEIDLTKVLAANAEVALNRAEHEAELADQREQLAELDRINEVIRDIDQLLVRAGTREEIEQAVCDRLADSDHYRFAWTGTTIVGNRIEPTASTGPADGYLDAVTVPVDHDDHGTGPAGRAVRTGETQVIESIADSAVFEPWREPALARGFRSMAAIPLRYRDTTYGVLCVYADRANALNDRETAVLSELGETIGHAINAVENKRALLADDVVEVEFDVTDGEGFFSRAAREEDCTFTLEGVTINTDGSFVHFVTVDGIDPDRLRERAEPDPDIERARLVNEHDDGHLFELVYTGPSLLSTLLDHGGTLRESRFTADGGRSVVELPMNADVRAAIESITDRIPGAEVVAQRERKRPDRTVQEFRAAIEDDLTDRQRSALEAAFYAGFFEWPRESTGEEVAESLGVSAPTFHQHLRVGERKLLAALLDE